jgi:type II secretory pathway pseudopilin PulG
VTADIRHVLSRARSQEGFGLIELLMAMTMLNIGILALIAAFQSGAFALQRASKLSTAAAIADIQMERYRSLKYEAIHLNQTLIDAADTTYTGDASYNASQVNTCTGSPLPEECEPSRNITGPDGKLYRVDTYIVFDTVTSSRQFKRVTIVIRERANLNGRALARIASTFDQSTGS